MSGKSPNQPSRSGSEEISRSPVPVTWSGVISTLLGVCVLALPGWGGERPSGGISAQPRQSPELVNEAADPDRGDLSAWRDVDPGLHSGFGSLDVSCAKSLPPPAKVTNATRLRGWKGERVSCKLLVWSKTGGEAVTVGKGILTDGEHEIPAEQITISAIRSLDGTRCVFLRVHGDSCGSLLWRSRTVAHRLT